MVDSATNSIAHALGMGSNCTSIEVVREARRLRGEVLSQGARILELESELSQLRVGLSCWRDPVSGGARLSSLDVSRLDGD